MIFRFYQKLNQLLLFFIAHPNEQHPKTRMSAPVIHFFVTLPPYKDQ